MCISNSPANFKGTKGYIGESISKEHGLVHVLGYQNHVQNKTNEANAMILHFPSKEAMGKNNVIETGAKGKNFLDFISSYFEFKTKGISLAVSNSSRSVEIFDTGIYTVVMSNKPSLINEALKDVPENKRPKINPDLMQWYEYFYPGYSIAVCCFNTSDKTQKADPIYWWYKPTNESELFFPAIDCHSGNIPDLTSNVEVDHILTCGIDDYHSGVETINISHAIKNYLNNESKSYFQSSILGINCPNYLSLPNGDFVIQKKDLFIGSVKFDRKVPERDK